MSVALAVIEPQAWQRVHRQLKNLAQQQASRDYELGKLLLEGLRQSVHSHLGYASFTEYVERLFGLSPRQVAERLRVAGALEELPALARALRNGALCWSVVRELTRVATAKTEREWLQKVENCTARQVEEHVRGHAPGDRPSDPTDPRACTQVLRFEVTAEVLATWREAVAALRHRMGPSERLSEEDALLVMARRVLAGPAEEGRASYQVAMTVCERCGRGWQQGNGELIPVGPEIVEMARCDAQHIGSVGGAARGGGGEGADGGVACEAECGDGCAGPCGEGCEGTCGEGCEGACGNGGRCAPKEGDQGSGEAHVGEDRDAADTHVGADGCHGRARSEPSQLSSTPPRASQGIAPRVRRAVVRRHNGCCAVPGCRNTEFLDVHHITPRADGGGSEPDDLVLLCGAHHRAAHRGFLIIEGRPTAGLRFLHADGSPYGGPVSAAAIDVHSTAYDALKRLGFRESKVRSALTGVRTHVDMDASIERVLEAALALLSP